MEKRPQLPVPTRWLSILTTFKDIYSIVERLKELSDAFLLPEGIQFDADLIFINLTVLRNVISFF